jgi:hypothetical protein
VLQTSNPESRSAEAEAAPLRAGFSEMDASMWAKHYAVGMDRLPTTAHRALDLRTISPRRWTFVLGLAWLMAASACVQVTPFVRSDEDERAEAQYQKVYAEHMQGVRQAFELFQPSGSNPGVCNSGGDKQGCYDADVIAIERFEEMLLALEANPVPPRYRDGDRLLREAIRDVSRGLELRNEAIAEDDQAKWEEHERVIKESMPRLLAAWEAFPVDNRPHPPP